MANSQRRILDRNGNQFIPMNVEGQDYNDSFWDTKKVICLILTLFCGGALIATITSTPLTIAGILIYVGGYLLIASYIFRYVIFEEKFYYRMYKELKGNEITTPAIFWNIASIKNTEDGAILTYADAKVGVLVKIDRDTITGKPDDFEETHYDAISDFYRDLTGLGYSFVQLNVMEMAGKDPRLVELDKLAVKCDNDNIRKLIELQVGHIKNIAQNSLYESDYILIYSYDITRMDNIIPDVIEVMFTLLEGAYLGYKIMNQRDLIELEKESFGIKYFNSTDASLNIYKHDAASSSYPFHVTGIVWDDGHEQELDDVRKNRLRNITTALIRETVDYEGAKIKENIYEKVDKDKVDVGIDFNKLGTIQGDNRGKGRIGIPRPNVNIPIPNMHRNMQNNNTNQQYYNNQMQNNNLYNNNNQSNQQLYFDNDFINEDEEDDDIVDI